MKSILPASGGFLAVRPLTPSSYSLVLHSNLPSIPDRSKSDHWSCCNIGLAKITSKPKNAGSHRPSSLIAGLQHPFDRWTLHGKKRTCLSNNCPNPHLSIPSAHGLGIFVPSTSGSRIRRQNEWCKHFGVTNPKKRCKANVSSMQPHCSSSPPQALFWLFGRRSCFKLALLGPLNCTRRRFPCKH